MCPLQLVALLLVSCYLFEMVKLTMIACITDDLSFAECLDGGYVKDVVFYKQQAKLVTLPLLHLALSN